MNPLSELGTSHHGSFQGWSHNLGRLNSQGQTRLLKPRTLREQTLVHQKLHLTTQLNGGQESAESVSVEITLVFSHSRRFKSSIALSSSRNASSSSGGSCGLLDNPSASLLTDPALYFILNLYVDNCASQRCPAASKFRCG